MSQLEFIHYDAEQASEIFDQLVEVYLEIYADRHGEFYGEDRYRRQLASHREAPGFALVIAYDAGAIAGYVYGFSLPENARWWSGMLTETPADLLRETGSRTFAICEIMTRKPWRSTGIGRALHDEILARRSEERATLLVDPENPARKIYIRWGWKKIGQLRPGWTGAPIYDSLILSLPLR